MKKIIGVMVIGLILIGVYFFGVNNREPNSLGSISSSGDAYTSTTTDTTWNTTTFPTGLKIIKTSSGILGSVVVSGATTATVLTFYDATTTGAHANHATTTIAKINTSTVAGTYTFDVAFGRGLVVEFPSALGAASSTITFK